MKKSEICPKCGGRTVRVPDNGRYANGNNIYTTVRTLFGRVPVTRYVCCECGFVEEWVELSADRERIRRAFG